MYHLGLKVLTFRETVGAKEEGPKRSGIKIDKKRKEKRKQGSR